MSATEEQVRDLCRRLADAEQAADVTALDALATEDFKLVGPRGFVLGKPEWLDRYQSGALRTASVVFDELAVRDYGDAAVAIGKQAQQATYAGRPADGEFRVTQVAVRDHDRWLLAGTHLSAIASPPAG